MNWYLSVLKQYATFTGRARRKEYWMFSLFHFIVFIVLSIIDGAIGTEGILGGLYLLATLLPSLAVGVRRLHDTGRSGWWILISAVPVIGVIVLLVFMCTDSQTGNMLDSTAGQNQYGPNPKLNKK